MTPQQPSGGFARALLLTFMATVGTAAMTLVNVLVIAWALGAEGRGTVAYAVVVLSTTSFLASLSVQESLANQVSAEPEARPALAGTALGLACVLGVGGAAVTFALVEFVPGVLGDLPRELILLPLVATPALVLYHYLLLFLRSLDDHAGASLGTALVPAVTLVANATLALVGILTPALAVVTWLAAQILAVGFLLGRVGAFSAPRRELARTSVTFGLKTHANAVMAVGNFRLDQWVLGALVGTTELGVYSVGVSVAEVLFFVPATVALVSRPSLVVADDRAFASHAAATFRASLLLVGGFGLLLFVLAPALIPAVFGSEFREAADYLRLLVPGAAGIVALKILGNALVARSRPLLESIAILGAFVVTVAGSIVLIPAIGATGAAITSSVAYLTAGGLVMVLFVRSSGCPVGDLVPSAQDVRVLLAPVRSRLSPLGASTR